MEARGDPFSFSLLNAVKGNHLPVNDVADQSRVKHLPDGVKEHPVSLYVGVAELVPSQVDDDLVKDYFCGGPEVALEVWPLVDGPED